MIIWKKNISITAIATIIIIIANAQELAVARPSLSGLQSQVNELDGEIDSINNGESQITPLLGSAPDSACDAENEGLVRWNTEFKNVQVCSGTIWIDVHDRAKIIFVTDSTYTGDLGGSRGADEKCQQEAVNRNYEGTFLAWLGSPTDIFYKNTNLYVSSHNDVIARNWNDLTDGNLQNFIAPSSGVVGVIPRKNFWSGVGEDGYPDTSISAGLFPNCGSWTIGTFFVCIDVPGGTVCDIPVTGGYGSNVETSNWSSVGEDPCNSRNHLLCIQQ